MPRSKPRKTGIGLAEQKFKVPSVAVRSSRRLTLAGPSQLISKQSLSPVIMLHDDFLGKIKKGMTVTKSQSKTGNKAAVKKAGSKQSPEKTKVLKASPKSAKATAVKESPKAKKVPSPKKSRHPCLLYTSPSPRDS